MEEKQGILKSLLDNIKNFLKRFSSEDISKDDESNLEEACIAQGVSNKDRVELLKALKNANNVGNITSSTPSIDMPQNNFPIGEIVVERKKDMEKGGNERI